MAVTPSNALFTRRLELYQITGSGLSYPAGDLHFKEYYVMLRNEAYLEWMRGGVQCQ